MAFGRASGAYAFFSAGIQRASMSRSNSRRTGLLR